MIEELFYKIVQHARVHELIPGNPIQLRLHVLSSKNYMSFAVKFTCATLAQTAMAALQSRELHPERLGVHEQLQWLLRLSTCWAPPTTRAVGTVFTMCTPPWNR